MIKHCPVSVPAHLTGYDLALSSFSPCPSYWLWSSIVQFLSLPSLLLWSSIVQFLWTLFQTKQSKKTNMHDIRTNVFSPTNWPQTNYSLSSQTVAITIIPVWCQTKRRYLCFVVGLRKHTDRSACRGLHWQDCFLLALYRRRQQSHNDAYGACIKPGSMSRDIYVMSQGMS